MKGDGKRRPRGCGAGDLHAVAAAAALHPAHVDGPTGAQGPGLAAEQIDVADLVDQLVVDRAHAVAEPELCAQVKMNLAATINGTAAECQARSPQIVGKRPFKLTPNWVVRSDTRLRQCRPSVDGGDGAKRGCDRNGCQDGTRTHDTRSLGSALCPHPVSPPR